MPVRETLDFSGRCLGVGTRHDLLVELTRQEKRAGIQPDPVIDAFMKATSMEHQETSLITDYALKIGLSLFRFVATLGRTEVVANTLGTFIMLLVCLLGGFIIARDDIEPWMIWGYYASPMMSNSVSDEDQPRVEKLSLKKKAIGSEARAERMANAERGRR